MPNEIPKRVFAVVVGCGLIASISGVHVAEYLTKLAAPYLVFGWPAVQEHIRITTATRFTVDFSNGITIHGWKMLRVQGACIIFSVIFIVSLFLLLLRIAGWVIRKRDAAYADDVVHFTKFE